MSVEELYFEYLKEGISPFKELIFKQLLSRIAAGSVLDLACGEAGIYWALGYITRAESLAFSDHNPRFLANLERQLENVDPESLEEEYGQTIAFLREQNFFPASTSSLELATQITEKAQRLINYDFLSSKKLDEEFDHVLSIGGLGCLDSTEQLYRAVSNIRSLIKGGGTFSGCVSPYSETTEYVNHLIANKMEGRLNPGMSQLKEAFEQNSFTVQEISKFQLDNNSPYDSVITFHLTKVI